MSRLQFPKSTATQAWKHLDGIQAIPVPKPKRLCDLGKEPTHEGKTMFADKASFLNAFREWMQKENPRPTTKVCRTAKVEVDCVPAAQVGVTQGSGGSRGDSMGSMEPLF